MALRDDFSEATKRLLRDRVGGYCSRIECGKQTVSPDLGQIDTASVTGRAAHITAAHPDGPRYDATLTPQQRKAPDNGVWLCADCADLVDKKKGREFTVENIGDYALDVPRVRRVVRYGQAGIRQCG